MTMTHLLFTLSLVVTSSLAADALSDVKNQAASLDTSLVSQLEQITPRTTRAGWLRYNDPTFLEPGAATWTLHELQLDDVAPEQRRALADALVRNLRNAPQIDLEAAWMQQIAQEADPVVRQVLIEGLRHATGPNALSALKTLLQHPDATSRAAAASTIGWRSDGAALNASLRTALADQDASVRHLAARSLGYLGDVHAFEALEALLDDSDPMTRAAALQALRRVDADRAATLDLSDLRSDTDARVQAATVALDNTSP
jgi:HEAT repeat protein